MDPELMKQMQAGGGVRSPTPALSLSTPVLTACISKGSACCTQCSAWPVTKPVAPRSDLRAVQYYQAIGDGRIRWLRAAVHLQGMPTQESQKAQQQKQEYAYPAWPCSSSPKGRTWMKYKLHGDMRLASCTAGLPWFALPERRFLCWCACLRDRALTTPRCFYLPDEWKCAGKRWSSEGRC